MIIFKTVYYQLYVSDLQVQSLCNIIISFRSFYPIEMTKFSNKDYLVEKFLFAINTLKKKIFYKQPLKSA